jgi:hypothetical protein
MQKIKVIIIFLVIIPLFTSCQTVNKRATKFPTHVALLKTELASFNLLNPEEDMERNFSHSDKRFIGICGIACFCPGLSKEQTGLINEYGMRIVSGTSDAIESAEHMQLQREATEYAKRYNEALFKKLWKYEIDG